jgi:DNA-binding NtrC family response regulator
MRSVPGEEQEGKENAMDERPSVLVVDDEDRFRENLIKLLGIHGLSAVGAESGAQALEILGSRPVDVILLDVKMPGMGGLDVLAEVKKIDPLIEVIVLTGHASVDTAKEIIALGGYDYLLKPHGIEDLIAKIETAFEKRRYMQRRGAGGTGVTS